LKFRSALLLAAMVLFPARSQAQDFGVMESAETINLGNFKLMANPLFIFGKDGGSGDNRIVLGAGFPVTSRLDIEGKAAFGSGTQIFGGNAEYWMMKHEPLDLSVIGGLHFVRGNEQLDTTAVDFTLLGSKHVGKRLEPYGALDIAFNRITDDRFRGDKSYTQVHLVPGIEYAISDELDFLAEVGIGVTDSSRHYVSFGIAYYIR
jgi:hypothetical protein